jgi:hypothetical protein
MALQRWFACALFRCSPWLLASIVVFRGDCGSRRRCVSAQRIVAFGRGCGFHGRMLVTCLSLPLSDRLIRYRRCFQPGHRLIMVVFVRVIGTLSEARRRSMTQWRMEGAILNREKSGVYVELGVRLQYLLCINLDTFRSTTWMLLWRLLAFLREIRLWRAFAQSRASDFCGFTL